MKLIIDIPEETYQRIKEYYDNHDVVEATYSYIVHGIPLEDIKAENLCNSCTNMACEFQYGIERSSCAFYMPPNAEPDNCGNYISIIDKHIGGAK